jgi:hypothetical protein
VRVGVLDAFMSTWSKARETFGEGVPQTGERFDQSGPLNQLKTTVDSAAPGSRWGGTAASAYGKANTDHGNVIGQVAGLDQRLGAQVSQAANIVQNGRQNLDAIRQWVQDAAGSVPAGKTREQLLLPIVQKGLGQVQDVITTSNGQLNAVGVDVKKLGGEYDALGNQKFGNPKEGPDLQGVKGDDKKPGDQAAEDWKAVQAGTATPEQIDRIRGASKLTQPQLEALQQGKPATMDQGQYDYLKGLMQAQDNMTSTKIDESLGKNPELKGAMGDAYRIMGNPNIQTAGGDHGGITNVPKGIQSLLNDDLTINTEGGGKLPQIPIHQFDALNDMLSHGDQNLRVGSDVDRALLNESSKVADLMDKGHAVYSDGSQDRGGKGVGFAIAGHDEINRTLNSMVDNASGDHQAVTDYLNGANDANSAGAHRMSDATFNHFTGNDGFRDLMTHHFDGGQDGMKHVFDWMGPNAYTDGLEGYDAASSANATAHLLANNNEFFNKLSDGHGGYTTLGQTNAGLTQTLTANLSPYIGNLDGVHTPGINADAIPGFTDTKDMSNMFKVLDTDPASAEALNNVVAQWEQHFAYDYGLTGDSELGRHAGQLTQAMENANHSTLDTFKSYHDWDALKAYQDRSAHWDTTTSILKDVAGFAPGGSWAVQLGDLAAPYIKDDVLGVPGDPGKMTETDWQKALTQTDANFNHLIDGRVRDFNIAQGYIDGHPGAVSQFQNVSVPGGTVNFVDANGHINWDTVNQFRPQFDQVLESPGMSETRNWDDGNHGYESGLNDTNIDPKSLPNPGDSRDAPAPPRK